MCNWVLLCYKTPVVPRKGDVDRNVNATASASVMLNVVPRKGDVDRNKHGWPYSNFHDRRPPQGGRG